jgi:hypothetical protein
MVTPFMTTVPFLTAPEVLFGVEILSMAVPMPVAWLFDNPLSNIQDWSEVAVQVQVAWGAVTVTFQLEFPHPE